MELILIYGTFAVALIFSWRADPEKTKGAFVVATNMAKELAPSFILIIGALGILMGAILPPEAIRSYLGEGAGFTGSVIAALFGSITLIPNVMAMPLAASFFRSGASAMTVAAFITTLTMVGTVTFPLEKEQLGLRFALTRNLVNFVVALVIAGLMGVFL
ncbi:MAG: permease [Clostridia bacterium]